MTITTVREFIVELQALPQDLPLIISTDAEGNELRMLNGVGSRYVEKLKHRFMNSIDEAELEDYDSWVLTAEIW